MVRSPGNTVTSDNVLTLSLNADVVVTGTRPSATSPTWRIPPRISSGSPPRRARAPSPRSSSKCGPFERPGEVLETVPGMIISQHSGEGKANQYYLRGFNLDHGTDFSTTVAGVPVNTPTGAHAHGYSDISFLIPELVSGVQFKKGPYFADEGDFSAAGAANINYVNHSIGRRCLLSAGNDGWGRLFGAASPRVGSGLLLAALELNHNDGPWVRPDDYEKVNGVLAVQPRRQPQRVLGDRHGLLGRLGLDGPGRAARRSPAAAISRFGAPRSADGGRTNRQSLAAEYPAIGGAVLSPRDGASCCKTA